MSKKKKQKFNNISISDCIKVGQRVKFWEKSGVVKWIHPKWRFALIERTVNCFGNDVKLNECVHLLHGKIFEEKNSSNDKSNEKTENKRIFLPGAAKPKKKTWTKEEIEKLNQMLSDGYSIYKISILLDRSYNSVKNRVYFITGKTVNG